MVGTMGLLDTMFVAHFLPFAFLVVNVYTTIPVGIKAYFLGQIAATVYVLQAIVASVTSVKAFLAAYLLLFQEGIFIVGVILIGVLYWSADEIGAGSRWEIDFETGLPGSPAGDSGRLSGAETMRGPIVRGEVAVVLFLCALVAARLATTILPSLPSIGGSLSSAPQVSVYMSELFYYDYEFIIKLAKILRLDLYLVIGGMTILALFPLGRDIGPRNMKYGYLTIGAVAQIVILPAVALGVFGLTLFGVTLVPPFAPVTLVGNVSVIAAPIFLLLVVVGAVTREFLRTAEHTYDT